VAAWKGLKVCTGAKVETVFEKQKQKQKQRQKQRQDEGDTENVAMGAARDFVERGSSGGLASMLLDTSSQESESGAKFGC
jgi:hypothetical protein